MWIRHPSQYGEDVVAQMKEEADRQLFPEEEPYLYCVFEAEGELPGVVLAATWGQDLLCEPITRRDGGVQQHIIWGFRDEGLRPWGEIVLLHRGHPHFGLPPWVDRRVQLGVHGSEQLQIEELWFLLSSIDFPGLHPPQIQPISGNGAYLFWKAD